MRVSLAVPHTPWRPERAASLQRLLGYAGQSSFTKIFQDRESHPVWTEKAWQWSVSQDVDYCLFLADDTMYTGDLGRFWDWVRALNEGNPGQIMGLTSQDPRATRLMRSGYNWYTFTAWTVGWGYSLPKKDLVEFLAWRAVQPKEMWSTWGDDQLINIWCYETNRQTWHPLPTLIDHDTTLESTVDHPIETEGRREANTKARPDSLGDYLYDPKTWVPRNVIHLTVADDNVWIQERYK